MATYSNSISSNVSDSFCTAEKATININTTDYLKASNWYNNSISAVPSTDVNSGVYTYYTHDFSSSIENLERHINDLESKNNKEEKKMSMFNFDFGPCTNNDVRLSMYGLAIRNTAGEWVSYNPESKEIINVEIATIKDGGKYMYKMPVAVSDVKVGDIVIHNKVPMFITAVNEDGTFSVTDVRAGETKTIIPTRNMFGFNFVTKIVSLFSTVSTAPTADQPFGNMLPFLMASEGEMDPMAMAMFMSMQGGKNNLFTQNPMMLYFLANSKESNMDPLVMMLMMNDMSK